VSGKVDGVRLPKSLFYVSRVMQNDKADIHIIGHWNYPDTTSKLFMLLLRIAISRIIFEWKVAWHC